MPKTMFTTYICLVFLVALNSGLQVFDGCHDDEVCPEGSTCTYRGCDGRLCLCNDGLLPDGNRTKCIKGISLGSACSPTSTCQGQPFSECINNVCQCIDGYRQSTSSIVLGGHCLPRSQGIDVVVEFGDYNDTCNGKDRDCSFDLECRNGTCICPNDTRLATKQELAASPYSYFLCRPRTFKLGIPINTSSEECQTAVTTTTHSTTISTTVRPTTTPTTTTKLTTTQPTTTSLKTSTTAKPTTSSTTTTTTTTTTPSTTMTSTSSPTTTTPTTIITTSTQTSSTIKTSKATVAPSTPSTTTSTTEATTTKTTETTTVSTTKSSTLPITTNPVSISSSTVTSMPTQSSTPRSTAVATVSSTLPKTTLPTTHTTPQPSKTELKETTTTGIVTTEAPYSNTTDNTTGNTVNIGEACAGKLCPNNSNCEADTCGERRCRCLLGYAESTDGETCLKLSALGESCGESRVCQGPFTECTEDGICDCQNEYERSDTGKWCRLKSRWLISFPLLGESCSGGFFSSCYMDFEQECVSSRCKCKGTGRDVGDEDRHAMYPDIRQCRNSTYIAGERDKDICKNQSKQIFTTDIYDKAKAKIHKMQAAIIGGSVGFLVLVGIIIGLVVLIRWKRRGKRQVIRDTSSMASSERYSFKIPRPFTHYVGSSVKEYDSQQIAYPNPVFQGEGSNSEPRPDVLNVTGDGSSLIPSNHEGDDLIRF